MSVEAYIVSQILVAAVCAAIMSKLTGNMFWSVAGAIIGTIAANIWRTI